MQRSKLISMEMPTEYGLFRLWVWDGDRGREPVAFSTVELDPKKEVMVRIHSECLTGDTFAALTCDCGPQKELALRQIREQGNGIFIYHRQEGRNMGLFKKVHAYNLMQMGMDTHEASLTISGHPDNRDYADAVAILEILLAGHASHIRLLTNNPYKRLFLERHGYPTVAQPLVIKENIHNAAYVATKAKKFLHASIGYGPYTGIEVSRQDIVEKGDDLGALLKKISAEHNGRKIFIGVRLTPEEARDASFAADLKEFQKKIARIHGTYIVFHTNYPLERRVQRTLALFFILLVFPIHSSSDSIPVLPRIPKSTSIL